MPVKSTRVLPVFLCVLPLITVGACRRGDKEPPVATPSVTVSRPDAAIGSPLDMTYRFVVAPDAPAFGEDYLVFVHFLDTDGELMWTDDHEPPTSTRQWKPGSTIEYTRTIFVPKFPYVGATRVEVGVFSPKSNVRLPLSGETRGQRAYTVATFNMRLQSDNLFVVFKDGWHDTETGDDSSGLEWQWSKKEGILSFRNPKRDVMFFLQVDQPITAAFAEPQRVEVRLGPTVVDSFMLPAGPRELRRMNISAAQLGANDTAELVVAVDKTFVPASIPQLQSKDVRELGIRVFRAYVQPR
jgi:hypothetical protein